MRDVCTFLFIKCLSHATEPACICNNAIHMQAWTMFVSLDYFSCQIWIILFFQLLINYQISSFTKDQSWFLNRNWDNCIYDQGMVWCLVLFNKLLAVIFIEYLYEIESDRLIRRNYFHRIFVLDKLFWKNNWLSVKIWSWTLEKIKQYFF